MQKLTFFKTMLLTIVILFGSASAWGQEYWINTNFSTWTTTPGTGYATPYTDATSGISFNEAIVKAGLGTSTTAGDCSGVAYVQQKASSVMTFPEYAGVGRVTFCIAAGSLNRSVKLYNGTTLLTTFTGIGTAGATFSYDVNSSANVNLILKEASNPIYIADLSVEKYAATTEQVETPEILPAGGSVVAPVTVTITCETAGAKIYYTLDGTPPTDESTEYTGSFTVLVTTTVKAIAVKEDMDDSNVATETYTFPVATEQVETPEILPAGGTITETSVEVTITCETAGAKIYYTLDGTPPTDESTEYTVPFTLTETTTVKAIAVKEGMDDSAVATETYTFPEEIVIPSVIITQIYGGGGNSGATPATYKSDFIELYNTTSADINISGWSIQYANATSVAKITNINTFPAGTVIKANSYYSIKGANGTSSTAIEWPEGTFDWTPTSGLINLATASGKVLLMKNSDPVTPSTLSVIVNDPNFCDYVPYGKTSEPMYGSSMTVEANNIQSVMRKLTRGVYQYTANIGNDFEPAVPNPRRSPVAEQVETPEILPASGEIAETSVEVTITCETAGATIYYTIDGEDPTTESTLYEEGGFTLPLTETTTVKAIAVKEDMDNSEIASVTYTLPATPQVEKPVILPASGEIAETSVEVTITCETAGAAIYYTIDGEDPTTESTLYEEGGFTLPLTETTTVKAIAVKEDMDNSEIASVTYTLPTSTPQVEKPLILPASGAIAETDVKVTITCATEDAVIYYTINGDAPTTSSTLYEEDGFILTVTGTATVKAIAVKEDMDNSEVASATYTLQIPEMPNVIITQIFGGGGNSGAIYKSDFIELYNTTSEDINIGNWSIQYASDQNVTAQITQQNTNVFPEGTIIKANSHYSIKCADGAGGEAWPEGTFDWTPNNLLALSGTAGKVILMKNDTRITPSTLSAIIDDPNFGDYVPYGKSSVPVYGSSMAANVSSTKSALRKSTEGVYQYTANIGNDFEIANPNPRKSPVEEQVETPVISPASSVIAEGSVEVTITCGTAGVKIYYTTDGEDPTTESTLYEGPFTLEFTSPTTVKAIAVKEGMLDSEIASETYTLEVGFATTQENTITMFVSDGILNVVSEGGIINIFDVLGRNLASVKANNGITSISVLPANQLIIVKINNKTGKIVVR